MKRDVRDKIDTLLPKVVDRFHQLLDDKEDTAQDRKVLLDLYKDVMVTESFWDEGSKTPELKTIKTIKLNDGIRTAEELVG